MKSQRATSSCSCHPSRTRYRNGWGSELCNNQNASPWQAHGKTAITNKLSFMRRSRIASTCLRYRPPHVDLIYSTLTLTYMKFVAARVSNKYFLVCEVWKQMGNKKMCPSETSDVLVWPLDKDAMSSNKHRIGLRRMAFDASTKRKMCMSCLLVGKICNADKNIKRCGWFASNSAKCGTQIKILKH